MPSGKKRKGHKMATHKRKKTPEKEPSQEKIIERDSSEIRHRSDIKGQNSWPPLPAKAVGGYGIRPFVS